MTPDGIVERLGLVAHPEGGMYAETWRDPGAEGTRGHGTAIYFLLRSGEVSRWHRVDAVEIYHHYAGDPLELRICEADRVETRRLGPAVDAGEAPQLVVPAGAWQSARSLGAWTLVGCTVCPAFVFEGFEMAPEGWEPAATERYTS